MSDYAFLVGVATILLFGAMRPGPSFFVVARNALAKSRAHGCATAVGTGLGVAFFAVLASFGVTTLFTSVPLVFKAFKFIGGGYLLFLAWRIWLAAPVPLSTELDLSNALGSLWQAFSQGFLTQTSNPKTALVIAGIFAVFMPAKLPEFTVLLVAVIAFIIDFSWYALVAISLSARRSREVYARAKIWLDRLASGLLGLIGLRLIFL